MIYLLLSVDLVLVAAVILLILANRKRKKELFLQNERQVVLQNLLSNGTVILERIEGKVVKDLELLTQVKNLLLRPQGEPKQFQEKESKLKKEASDLLEKVKTLEGQKKTLLQRIVNLELMIKKYQLLEERRGKYTENSPETRKSEEPQEK